MLGLPAHDLFPFLPCAMPCCRKHSPDSPHTTTWQMIRHVTGILHVKRHLYLKHSIDVHIETMS